jgi:hypothetical protein
MAREINIRKCDVFEKAPIDAEERDPAIRWFFLLLFWGEWGIQMSSDI